MLSTVPFTPQNPVVFSWRIKVELEPPPVELLLEELEEELLELLEDELFELLEDELELDELEVDELLEEELELLDPPCPPPATLRLARLAMLEPFAQKPKLVEFPGEIVAL